MKMYTNESQTTKLMELGFEKPRYYCADKYTIIHTSFDIINYSIGELIEMLPKEINNDILPDTLGAYIDHNGMWAVGYSCVLGEQYSTCRTELIDALYDMVVKLKDEGVI